MQQSKYYKTLVEQQHEDQAATLWKRASASALRGLRHLPDAARDEQLLKMWLEDVTLFELLYPDNEKKCAELHEYCASRAEDVFEELRMRSMRENRGCWGSVQYKKIKTARWIKSWFMPLDPLPMNFERLTFVVDCRREEASKLRGRFALQLRDCRSKVRNAWQLLREEVRKNHFRHVMPASEPSHVQLAKVSATRDALAKQAERERLAGVRPLKKVVFKHGRPDGAALLAGGNFTIPLLPRCVSVGDLRQLVHELTGIPLDLVLLSLPPAWRRVLDDDAKELKAYCSVPTFGRVLIYARKVGPAAASPPTNHP